MGLSDFPHDKINDYFNASEDMPREEPTYEYRVCEFCLTPSCEDCLPWDFNIFKLSEISLYFPDAIVNKEGVIEVHKHKHCRCGLFPVSGFILDDDLMSDDVRDKIQAIRNHKLAFREEDNNSLLNELQAMSRQQDAEAAAVAAMKKNDPFEALSKSRQMTFNFTGNGELQLSPKIETQLAQVNNKQVEAFRLSPRRIRELQAFRSPQALAHVGMREGIGAMGEVGLLGDAAAVSSSITPLAFFLVLPELEKVLKVWFDNYMKTQQVKAEKQYNTERANAYLNVYRGIIPA